MERKREVSNDFMLRRGIIAMKTEGVIVKVVCTYVCLAFRSLLVDNIDNILFIHNVVNSTQFFVFRTAVHTFYASSSLFHELDNFFFELFGLIPLCRDAKIY